MHIAEIGTDFLAPVEHARGGLEGVVQGPRVLHELHQRGALERARHLRIHALGRVAHIPLICLRYILIHIYMYIYRERGSIVGSECMYHTFCCLLRIYMHASFEYYVDT